jgi:hypothetical protein
MKQELLLKSEHSHADAALARALRIVLYIAAAVYWLHETFSTREASTREASTRKATSRTN